MSDEKENKEELKNKIINNMKDFKERPDVHFLKENLENFFHETSFREYLEEDDAIKAEDPNRKTAVLDFEDDTIKLSFFSDSNKSLLKEILRMSGLLNENSYYEDYNNYFSQFTEEPVVKVLNFNKLGIFKYGSVNHLVSFSEQANKARSDLLLTYLLKTTLPSFLKSAKAEHWVSPVKSLISQKFLVARNKVFSEDWVSIKNLLDLIINDLNDKLSKTNFRSHDLEFIKKASVIYDRVWESTKLHKIIDFLATSVAKESLTDTTSRNVLDILRSCKSIMNICLDLWYYNEDPESVFGTQFEKDVLVREMLKIGR